MNDIDMWSIMWSRDLTSPFRALTVGDTNVGFVLQQSSCVV